MVFQRETKYIQRKRSRNTHVHTPAVVCCVEFYSRANHWRMTTCTTFIFHIINNFTLFSSTIAAMLLMSRRRRRLCIHATTDLRAILGTTASLAHYCYSPGALLPLLIVAAAITVALVAIGEGEGGPASQTAIEAETTLPCSLLPITITSILATTTAVFKSRDNTGMC